jgi:hypothetical protein
MLMNDLPVVILRQFVLYPQPMVQAVILFRQLTEKGQKVGALKTGKIELRAAIHLVKFLTKLLGGRGVLSSKLVGELVRCDA